MNIFAIDPGPEQSGYLILEDLSRIAKFGIIPTPDIMREINSWNHGGSKGAVVCEMVASYGMPVGKEIFDTCRWIGRFEQFVANRYSSFHLLTRLQVKTHLCHDSRAKDSNIRQALIDRLGKPGTETAPGFTYGITKHLWSALALAVTFHDLNSGTEAHHD